ncbi:MAG: TauD/TfdA family dioxygenase [Bacteroidia bacterium]|nr:TauD/TfdA family dioxygenase [Bacteroidia bacterium]
MDYLIEKVSPFGALLINNGGPASIEQFSEEQLHHWISAYKVVVFRGFAPLSRQELALFAQQLGKPMQWPFGSINDLKVKAEAENYIFTNRKVPVHWDGAFTGNVPHIILFQCLVAPEKEDLGGTTFVNTENILSNATASQMEEWQNVSVTYKTEKLAHYGGEFTQKFLDKHKVGQQAVIRYAEPVDDLNPVTVSIEGLEEKPAETFIAEIEELLYQEENLYIHRWEEGDLVLADNHSLLHGREAFKKQKERHIQRINILHRPKGFSFRRFLENSLTIRRKEFFVAELPIFIIPLLLSLGSWSELMQPMLYLGLIAGFLLFNIGDMVNCYADYKLDSIYKSHLSNAVFELGKKNVKWQIILTGIAALLLVSFIAAQSSQLFLIPMVLIGGFIGIQYSLKPFQFKSQGILQFFCLWGIIFFGPMLFMAIIFKGIPSLTGIFLFAFYGFHQMGIILLNTAEDYPEDMNDGLNTIIVSLGLHRSIRLAFGIVLFSGIALIFGTLLLFYNAQLSPWAYSSVLIFVMGWLVIVKEYRLILNKIQELDEEAAVKEIKKNGMKVPRWLKIGAYTFLACISCFAILTVS